MGNGAKAQMKREKNSKDSAGGKSILKTKQAAQTIQCKTCFQTFQNTTKRPELTTHADSRHSKTFEQCFPGLEI